jgi:guanylate kinase
MRKLFVVMGKSATGKDTIYKEIVKRNNMNLLPVVMYTTRPIREGEVNGREYNFVDENTKQKIEKKGKILEIRTYNTVEGPWHYFTADDENWEDDHDHIMIGTLESYAEIRKNCSNIEIIPIYIEVEDGERLNRALIREKKEKNPNYEELCRRFIADTHDFSQDKIKSLEINKVFINNNLEDTIDEILNFLKECTEK